MGRSIAVALLGIGVLSLSCSRNLLPARQAGALNNGAALASAGEPADPADYQQLGGLESRFETLTRSLTESLPSWTWDRPAGGLSIWVRLPTPTAENFAQAALRHGVAVATAPALSPSTRHVDRLRLSFSGPPELLEEGVRRLARTWNAHTGNAG